MESLKTAVRRNLKGAERVAVLAIGSSLRGDDAAGLQVADQLRRVRTKARSKAVHSALRIFMGETAPENLTGEIKKFRPTHLVILDAADAGGKRPGSITLIQHDVLRGGSSI
jgi:hydrogenase maturation protease